MLLIFRPAGAVQLVVLALGIYLLVKSVVVIIGTLRQRISRAGAGRLREGIMTLIVGAVVLIPPAVSAIVSVELAYFGLGIGAADPGPHGADRRIPQGAEPARTEIAIGALQLVLAVLLFVAPIDRTDDHDPASWAA